MNIVSFCIENFIFDILVETVGFESSILWMPVYSANI
jgi:hypothetical protein